jgi:hypothetical protein
MSSAISWRRIVSAAICWRPISRGRTWRGSDAGAVAREDRTGAAGQVPEGAKCRARTRPHTTYRGATGRWARWEDGALGRGGWRGGSAPRAGRAIRCSRTTPHAPYRGAGGYGGRRGGAAPQAGVRFDGRRQDPMHPIAVRADAAAVGAGSPLRRRVRRCLVTVTRNDPMRGGLEGAWCRMRKIRNNPMRGLLRWTPPVGLALREAKARWGCSSGGSMIGDNTSCNLRRCGRTLRLTEWGSRLGRGVRRCLATVTRNDPMRGATRELGAECAKPATTPCGDCCVGSRWSGLLGWRRRLGGAAPWVVRRSPTTPHATYRGAGGDGGGRGGVAPGRGMRFDDRQQHLMHPIAVRRRHPHPRRSATRPPEPGPGAGLGPLFAAQARKERER